MTPNKQAHTQLDVFAKALVPGWTGGGLNHSHAVALGEGNYAIQFYGGGVRGIANAKPITPAEKAAHAEAIALDQRLRTVTTRIAQMQMDDAPQYALAVCDVDDPADSPIYRRGDFQNLGEVVIRQQSHLRHLNQLP